MEDDILSYLPPLQKFHSSSSSSSLSWSFEFEVLLKRMQKGRVQSGKQLVLAIGFLREALCYPSETISKPARSGYKFFFDGVLREDESSKWFNEVVPKLARLLLKLPSLLEAHYEKNALMDIHGDRTTVTTALRVLESQRAGVVCLSQELIAALLACSFFCLYPDEKRHANHLPMVNFDQLFAALDYYHIEKIRNKIWCIFVYFERINFDKPMGIVSFERRVLHKNDSTCPSYPDADFWRNSANPLCEFQVHTSGLVEDQSSGAVEVYFAGKNIGGDALGSGTSHAENRFMLSPELIAGMLFLPAMNDNEAIEIVGAERFLTYDDYESSFRFSDVYVDKTELDALGRRKTRIVAVDRLCTRKDISKYTGDIHLREINKAFCGFVHRPCENNIIMGVSTGEREYDSDPEMNVIIKWIAASQAERPFLAYCTFGREELKNLGHVADWISSKGWTVGDVWSKLTEYAFYRCHVQGFNDCFSQWVQHEKRLTFLAREDYLNKRHKPTQEGLTGLIS